jgi:hypothetical protein
VCEALGSIFSTKKKKKKKKFGVSLELEFLSKRIICVAA